MNRFKPRLVVIAVGACAVAGLGCGASTPPPPPPPIIAATGEPGAGARAGEEAPAPPPAQDGRYRELWSREPAGGWAEASVFLPSGDLASVSRRTLTVHARHDGTALEQARVCDVIGPRAMTVMRGKLYLACQDRVVEVTLPGLTQKVMVRGVIDNGRSLFREAAFGGDKVAFTHNDGSMEVYSTTTWLTDWEQQLDKDTFAQPVAVSSDGRKITVSNDDAEVIHLFVNGKRTKLADGLSEALAFSPDGTRVFGRAGSFQVGELDLQTGQLRSLGRTGSWVTAGVYFGDGMLAIAGSDGLSVVRLADGDAQRLVKMTAETLAVSDDGRMICGADRGDQLACYAKGPVAPSTYEPADEAPEVAPSPGKPGQVARSSKPAAASLPGKLIGRTGATLTVELASIEGIAKGTSGKLQRRFERKFGTITASGWLEIASVTVTDLKGSTAQLRIDVESSVIRENGRKVNHFTPGAEVQLIVER